MEKRYRIKEEEYYPMYYIEEIDPSINAGFLIDDFIVESYFQEQNRFFEAAELIDRIIEKHGKT